jgi:hypothetical protein
LCEVCTRLVDADTLNNTIGIEINGDRNGIRIDCRVYGFEETGERILKVTGSMNGCENLDVTFRGDFVNLTYPGDETAGVRKYIDIGAGWTGSIPWLISVTIKLFR